MAAPRRHYLDNTPGQLHVWQWQGDQSALPPIVCLPPVPYGGRFFDSFAQAYDGPVWSADLPGYGFSDALGDAPTVSGYTDAMTPLLNAPGQPVWLAGFHSGALVAMEMANHFEQVSGLVLVDVPVFVPTWRSLPLTTPQNILNRKIHSTVCSRRWWRIASIRSPTQGRPICSLISWCG